jgi:uncharacterized membrane protein
LHDGDAGLYHVSGLADGMRSPFSILLLSIFFIAAGVNHFLNPQPYLAMMPPALPFPEALNFISGAAEVLGGLGVLMHRFRRAAGVGLMILLLAIFPANIHVAMHGWAGVDLAPWVLWARLPFQVLFMVWVYYACLARPKINRSWKR